MWILVIFVFAALLVINFVGYLEGKSGGETPGIVVLDDRAEGRLGDNDKITNHKFSNSQIGN
ncbi:MAG: hypothetical protein UX62_C0038G0004 [Microgenomates group bacterium GW2011_GWA2_46_7]|nr:MAG: hypothetical protein UX62_C0038G0004 [Microgenomates group bacterium GW2011_GWA2_46_7]